MIRSVLFTNTHTHTPLEFDATYFNKSQERGEKSKG